MKTSCLRFVPLLLAVFGMMSSKVFSQMATFRPGDVFDMRMTSVPDPYGQPFTGTYTIAEDGTVGIPLLKDSVKAAGLSMDQLVKAIDAQLIAEKIFTHPLAVIQLPPQTRVVTLGGPGMRQGTSINYTSDMTLSSAIMRAGGFSDYGNQKKIKLTRGGKSQFFNLKKADKDPSQNPKLLPGDEVEVPE